MEDGQRMESKMIEKDVNTKRKQLEWLYQSQIKQSSRKGVLTVIEEHFVIINEHIDEENPTILNVQQLQLKFRTNGTKFSIIQK